ncbi:SiaB family protein kinase [Crocinitomix algicola]|uniref:SiaB family protein kinase n=1 Tax=Crocinitomix algicola TaxID=1740263 RepID=UPI001112DE18|nr:SiaB family protein kinase [Crocinitomix algicola]
MMLHRNNLVEKCNAQFQKIFGDYNIQADGKILVSHFGEFSQDLVNSLTTNIEEMMIESGDKKATVKRMFSILVEGLQNARIHGEKDSDGNQVSFLIVLQNEDDYRFTFGNLVKAKNIGYLTKKIDDLNGMNRAEIKAIYMDTLSNGIMSKKGGAGLGYITMALKSNNKIDYEVLELSDDLMFFTQSIQIERLKA